jgi:hypothetical protein
LVQLSPFGEISPGARIVAHFPSIDSVKKTKDKGANKDICILPKPLAKANEAEKNGKGVIRLWRPATD